MFRTIHNTLRAQPVADRIWMAALMLHITLLPLISIFSRRAIGGALFVALVPCLIIMLRYAKRYNVAKHLLAHTVWWWWAAAGMVIFSLTTFMFSPDLPEAWTAMTTKAGIALACAFAAAMYVRGLADETLGITLERLFLGSWVLGLLICATDAALGYPLQALLDPEKLGSYNNANTAIVVLAVLSPFALALLRARFSNRLFWVALAAIGGLVVTGHSQSALLAWVAAMLAWALATRAPLTTLWLLGTAFILWTWAVPFVAPLLHHYVVAHGLEMKEVSLLGRLEIWSAVSHMVQNNPLYGMGFEATRLFDFGWINENQSMPKEFSALHPHSMSLQLWAEGGMLAVLWATIGTVMLIDRLRALPAANLPVASAVLAALMGVSFSAFGLWQAWWMVFFAVCLGMLFGKARRGTR